MGKNPEFETSAAHRVFHGPWLIDFGTSDVLLPDGNSVHLSPRELNVFMRLTEEYTPTPVLLQRLRGLTGLQVCLNEDGLIANKFSFGLDPNVATTLPFTYNNLRDTVKTLRQKLGHESIENRWGHGYRLAPAVDSSISSRGR